MTTDPMEKSLKEVQEELIEAFSIYDDWLDRYNYLIELGTQLEPFDPELRTKENLVNGCQSKVWLNAEYQNGRIRFEADSDAIIVKGLVALLLKVLNNRTPGEILNHELYFIERIGLKENLSPTRSNGLLSMVKKMRLYALAYRTKYETGG